MFRCMDRLKEFCTLNQHTFYSAYKRNGWPLASNRGSKKQVSHLSVSFHWCSHIVWQGNALDPQRRSCACNAAQFGLLFFFIFLSLSSFSPAQCASPAHAPASFFLTHQYSCEKDPEAPAAAPFGGFLLGMSTVWIFGMTPPPWIVTLLMYLLSSSSLRIASWM